MHTLINYTRYLGNTKILLWNYWNVTVKEAVSFRFFFFLPQKVKKREYLILDTPPPQFLFYSETKSSSWRGMNLSWLNNWIVSPTVLLVWFQVPPDIRKNQRTLSCIQEVGIILFIRNVRKVYFSMKPGKLLRFEKNTISSILFPENLSVVSTLTTFKFKKCPSPSLPQPLSHHSLYFISPLLISQRVFCFPLFNLKPHKNSIIN